MKLKLPTIKQHPRLYRYTGRVGDKLVFYGMKAAIRVTNVSLKPRSRVLIVCKNYTLLIKDIGSNGKWTLPGGGRKPDETYAECARREVREELDIDATLERYKELKTYNKKHNHSFDKVCFVLDVTDTNESVRLGHEVLVAKWFHLGDLPGNIQGYAKEAYGDYLEQIG